MSSANCRKSSIFCAYATEDAKRYREFDASLTKKGVTGDLLPRKIPSGPFTEGVHPCLKSSSVIVFLLSKSFVASGYHKSEEVRRAFDLHDKKKAQIVAVLLEECDRSGSRFADFPALPNDQPSESWKYRPVAFDLVAARLGETMAVKRRASLESKRKSQNFFNLVMMTALLCLVIGANGMITAALTGGGPRIFGAPINLGVEGTAPDLYQLGLDADNAPRFPVPPRDARLKEANRKLDAIARATKPDAEKRLIQERTEAGKALSEAKAAIARQYAGRLRYIGFTVFYVALFAVTAALGFYVMCNTLRVYPPEEDSVFDAVKNNRAILLWWALAAGVSSLSAWYVYNANINVTDINQVIMQTIIRDFANKNDPVALYEFFNALSLGIAIYLAAIAVSVMWHPQFRPYDPSCKISENRYRVETEARCLGVQLKQLKLLLYIGTAMLVARIIQLNEAMNWILAFAPSDPTLVAGVKDMLNALVTARAVFYTLLLACIYLPAAAVLSERIAKLADQENISGNAEDRKKWLAARDLNFDYAAQIPHLIAILGPLIAGPAKELLRQIGNK